MDSVSRKRKLVDCGSNTTVARKQTFVNEEISNQEENELNACNQYRVLGCEEPTGEQGPKEGSNDRPGCGWGSTTYAPSDVAVFQKKSTNKLGGLVKLSEKNEEIESRNSTTDGKSRDKKVYQVNVGNEADDDCDDEDEEDGESQSSNGRENGDDRTEIVWFSTDYIEDIIANEMKKEAAFRLSPNFCRKYDINPTGREILVDWLISVQVHLKAENCTLHLAVALLDSMLDSVHIPINELQAAAVAAFWVAYKYIHGSLSMKTLLNLCAGSVTKGMIEANEILVLQTSRLLQAGGSLTVFFNYLLHKIFGFKFPPEIYYCGLYFMEIMLLQFVFTDCPAYEKAVTAVFTALAVFGCSERFLTLDVSNFISKRKLLHVYRRLMRSLRLMYNDRNALKNSNVYRKYKSSRYFKISVHQCLKCLATP